MKNLIFSNFLKDVLKFFIMSLLIMGVIVWTMQAVNFFDFVTEDGHDLKIYFNYTLLNFPKIIHRILPFLFFISLFFSIIKYENTNQLNIFWLNGISKIKFINILLIFSLVIMIIQIFLGSYLSPISQLKARNLIKNSELNFFTSLIKEGKFINAVKGLTIFIEKKNLDIYSNIFIDDSTRGYSRFIYAKTGKIISNQKNKQFILYDGKVINKDQERINIFEFDQINFNLNSFNSNSIITPKIQETNSLALFNCVIDLELFSKNKCRDRGFSQEKKQELLKRFFKPIYIPLITILCCFLLISGKYRSNYSKTKKYLFLSIFILILFSETLLRYSTTNIFFLKLYFLTPLILFFLLYIFSYHKINNA